MYLEVDSSFSIAEKEAKKLDQKAHPSLRGREYIPSSPVRQFLVGHPAQLYLFLDIIKHANLEASVVNIISLTSDSAAIYF